MTMSDVQAIALQVAKAIGYYVILVVMMRLAGKRLAGQTTTFDLIVLITLGATVQNAMVGSNTSLYGGILAAGSLLLSITF